MKFSIAVNLERTDAARDMRTVARNAVELEKLAEQGGFEIAWAQEHHTIELSAAPNPFTILMNWAANTSRIRLGVGVVVAPYWHPLRVAGEAALFDVFTDGRLELGFGRGAFQYEFNRMAGGIDQKEGGRHLREMMPLVLQLWQGDVAHDGAIWQFPAATSVPKPLQTPRPPIWVAARDPDTFLWAMKNGANIMATPLSKPHAEVAVLGQRFADTLAQLPGIPRPRFLMLRRCCVYAGAGDWTLPVEASIAYGLSFENLFSNVGVIRNGFPEPARLSDVAAPENYTAEAIRESMVFGTPDQVVAKLRDYEAAGVDSFCYGASFGLPHAVAMRSLELFITEVMPHFADTGAAPMAA